MALKITMWKCLKCGETYGDEQTADNCCKMPQMREQPDLDNLRSFVSNIIDGVANNGALLKDAEYEVFALVLKAFYGKQIFKWIDEQPTE